MKYIIIIGLFIVNINAKNCFNEYDNHPTLTDMWSIRIEDKIGIYGCRVVPIYALLKDTNSIELMDAIDEDVTILKPLIDLFKHKQLLQSIVKNEMLKTILIDNAQQKQFLSNMNYLFKRELNRDYIEKINRDITYLQYFVVAAVNAKNKTQLRRYYKKLIENVSADKIDNLLFISISLKNSYDFELLLENFLTLKKSLSAKQLNELVKYPKEFVYFLYPSKEDMHLYNDSDFYIKQKKFQKLIISIYKNSYKYYTSLREDANFMSLGIIENIYPYMVVRQDYESLEKLFNELISSGLFLDYSLYPCSNVIKKNYAKLFGGNNIDNIIRFKEEKYSLYKELLNSESKNKNIFSLFYIVNVNSTFSKDKKEIFFNLLNNLTLDKYTNSFVLYKLEQIQYFDNIIRYKDYKKYVNANDDDLNGMSAQKYMYILTTSSYTQNDPPVLEYLNNNNIKKAKELLEFLYSKSIADLESHRFTAYERSAYIMDKIDDIALVIYALPTGGATLGALLAKSTTKSGIKKGFKIWTKKLAHTSKKIISRRAYGSTKTSSMSLSQSEKSFRRNLNQFDNKYEVFRILIEGGRGMYFALSNSLQAEELCPKNKE